MDCDLNTPPHAPPSCADRSTSRPTQMPEQLGANREGSQSRSPAPRFPNLSSPSTAPRGSNPNRATASYSPSSSTPQSPQQHQQQQNSYHSRGRRSNRATSDAFNARNNPRSGGTTRKEQADFSWRQRSAVPSGTSPGQTNRARKPSPSGNSPDEDRRRCQRDKQIHFGYATDGYVNMERLIRHDPLLKSGGLLPLSPPTVVKGSKRIWDIQLRKWRRALHMFDYVFIDGEDDPASRANVLEEQRQQWVSEVFHAAPRELRKRIALDALRRVQCAPSVPTKIPVEDDLRCILRSEDCYESVRSVVPQSASSLTKGTDISPLEAGIKIHIAPSSAVLQRQRAQQELQQRLSALQQQQHQQLQPQVPVEVSVDAVLITTPPRHTSPSPKAAARQAPSAQPPRMEAPSPSPRRPLLPSPAESHMTKTAAASGKQQHNPLSASHRTSGGPSPAVVAPTEVTAAATATVSVVAPTSRALCAGSTASPSLSSSVSAAITMMSCTAGASASQPTPYASGSTGLGRFSGELSVTVGGGVRTSRSPTTTSVFSLPPSFPDVAPPPQPSSNTFLSSSLPKGTFSPLAHSYFTGSGGCRAGCAPMPWCEVQGVSTERVSGVAYGLPHTATAVMQPCGVSGTPWGPQPIFADPSTVSAPVTLSAMTSAVESNAGAGPIMAKAHLESLLSGCPPDTLASPTAHPPQMSNRSLPRSVYFSSLEQVAEARTPSGVWTREDRHRSCGGSRRAGVDTPQTIPRFVARLSTSPSEQRLGKQSRHQQQQQQRESESREFTQVWKSELSPDLSQKNTQRNVDRLSIESPASAAVKKSPSFENLTPKRSLFDAAAQANARTEARPVQLCGDSTEQMDDDGAAEKGRMEEGVNEDIAVAALSFHTETA